MTRSEALRLLDDKSSHLRLRAARFFAIHAHPDDDALVRKRLATEDVFWIRSALQMALTRLSAQPPADMPDTEGQEAAVARQVTDIYAQAIEETAAGLVHELEPLLGLLRLHARTEIGNYAESRTRRQLDRFESVLAAFDTLSRAAGVPRLTDLDLAEAIRRLGTSDDAPVEIELAGPSPLPIRGDTSLIELAVANGIRNAIEASETSTPAEQKARVTVNWGESDRDYWVVVLDRGIGIPTNAARMFEIGATTKEGHLGMGLALARRAALSLGGTLSVTRREDRGARFELRWPKMVLDA